MIFISAGAILWLIYGLNCKDVFHHWNKYCCNCLDDDCIGNEKDDMKKKQKILIKD